MTASFTQKKNIDDGFIIYTCDEAELDTFLSNLNARLKLSYKKLTQSITFLDTQVYIAKLHPESVNRLNYRH